MSQGKPLSREVRDQIARALRAGDSLTAIVDDYKVSHCTVTRIRAEEGITGRAKQVRAHEKVVARDTLLVPHLHALRELESLDRAAFRGAQLRLYHAQNDPSKLHEGAA